MPKPTAEERILTALRCPKPDLTGLTERAAEEAVALHRITLRARLAGIEATGANCGRCAGQGYLLHYSHRYNGECFDCRGSGRRMPRLTAALADEVEARVAEGRLDAWARVQQARHNAKRSLDRLAAKAKASPIGAAYEAAYLSKTPLLGTPLFALQTEVNDAGYTRPLTAYAALMAALRKVRRGSDEERTAVDAFTAVVAACKATIADAEARFAALELGAPDAS